MNVMNEKCGKQHVTDSPKSKRLYCLYDTKERRLIGMAGPMTVATGSVELLDRAVLLFPSQHEANRARKKIDPELHVMELRPDAFDVLLTLAQKQGAAWLSLRTGEGDFRFAVVSEVRMLLASGVTFAEIVETMDGGQH